MSDFSAIILALALVLLLVGLIIRNKNSTRAPSTQPEESGKENSVPTHQAAAKPATYGGTIGEMSQRIGYDVRDLLMAGFTHSEIRTFTREEMIGVMHGKYTLAELRKKKSAGN